MESESELEPEKSKMTGSGNPAMKTTGKTKKSALELNVSASKKGKTNNLLSKFFIFSIKDFFLSKFEHMGIFQSTYIFSFLVKISFILIIVMQCCGSGFRMDLTKSERAYK